MNREIENRIDDAINQLKENYEISTEQEKLFRQCYEMQFMLTENEASQHTQQEMDRITKDMVKLLASCSLKMTLPKGSEIVFKENGNVDFIKMSDQKNKR